MRGSARGGVATSTPTRYPPANPSPAHIGRDADSPPWWRKRRAWPWRAGEGLAWGSEAASGTEANQFVTGRPPGKAHGGKHTVTAGCRAGHPQECHGRRKREMGARFTSSHPHLLGFRRGPSRPAWPLQRRWPAAWKGGLGAPGADNMQAAAPRKRSIKLPVNRGWSYISQLSGQGRGCDMIPRSPGHLRTAHPSNGKETGSLGMEGEAARAAASKVSPPSRRTHTKVRSPVVATGTNVKTQPPSDNAFHMMKAPSLASLGQPRTTMRARRARQRAMTHSWAVCRGYVKSGRWRLP